MTSTECSVRLPLPRTLLPDPEPLDLDPPGGDLGPRALEGLAKIGVSTGRGDAGVEPHIEHSRPEIECIDLAGEGPIVDLTGDPQHRFGDIDIEAQLAEALGTWNGDETLRVCPVGHSNPVPRPFTTSDLTADPGPYLP